MQGIFLHCQNLAFGGKNSTTYQQVQVNQSLQYRQGKRKQNYSWQFNLPFSLFCHCRQLLKDQHAASNALSATGDCCQTHYPVAPWATWHLIVAKLCLWSTSQMDVETHIHTYIHATFFIFIFYDINVHNMYVYDILSFCKYTWYRTIHTHIPRRKFDGARCAEVLTDQFIACGGRKHANAVLDGNLIHGVATMVLLEELKSWNRHSNFGSIVWFKHSIPMIGGHNDSVKNARVTGWFTQFQLRQGRRKLKALREGQTGRA